MHTCMQVVDKLGVEMEAAERRATQQHELRVREMRADHAKALSQLQAERTELQTKYMTGTPHMYMKYTHYMKGTTCT